MKAKSVLSLAPLTILPVLISVIRADYEKNTFGLYTIPNVPPNYLEFMPTDDFEVTVNRDVIRSHPQYQEYVEVVKKYLAEQALKEIQRNRQPPPQQFENDDKNKKKSKDEDDSGSEELEEEDDEKQEKVSSEENFDDDDDDDQPQNDEAAFDHPIEVHLQRPKNKDKNKKKPEKTEDDKDKENSQNEETQETKPWLVSRVFTRVKSMVPKMPRLPTPKLRLTFESPSRNKKNKKDKNKNKNEGEENDDEPKRTKRKPNSQGPPKSSDSVYEQHMQLHHHHQDEVYGGKVKLTKKPTGFGFNFSGGPPPPKRESEYGDEEQTENRKPYERRNPKFPFFHIF